MNMTDWYGNVITFVGLRGSGKTYNANMLYNTIVMNKGKCLMFDFSDGIRLFVDKIIRGVDVVESDIDFNKYNEWKLETIGSLRPISSGERQYITGRDMLKRVGEGMKAFAGKDIWCNYTVDKVLNTYEQFYENEQDKITIILNSVRFENEARAVFKVAEFLKKKAIFIYCNHSGRSYNYDVKSMYDNDPTEVLSLNLLKFGCQHNEDITNIMKRYQYL